MENNKINWTNEISKKSKINEIRYRCKSSEISKISKTYNIK